jgi:hypothetical protein
MGFKAQKSTIRTVRQDDPLFTFTDGIVVAKRAGLHVLPECPAEYATIIHEAIRNGWLKPVAYMRDNEMAFEILATA